MSILTITIVIAFLIGYACIALESLLHINKAAIALLMCVICWTLFMMSPSDYLNIASTEMIASEVGSVIERHLGATSTTLFFLMGAMTIVEIIDRNGGFNFVRGALRTTSKSSLLWRIALMSFFLSAVLDNMTTSIVMVMVLRKLIVDKKERMIYASLVVIAANSGGAFSPIGDVTTIMLWNANLISASKVITELILPSLVSMIVPTLMLQTTLKGTLIVADNTATEIQSNDFSNLQRKMIFFLGIGGLLFVPVFKAVTHLPPFVGILLVLALLWVTTEVFYAHLSKKTNVDSMKLRVSGILSRIDMSTILFFLGILMAVSCLEEIGVLAMLGQWLDTASGGNHYIVTGAIGVISSIVDNVPLVAGCMGMYPLETVGDMATDGIFWQLLAYCAGVGGSLLIIGSAAGVVVMGLERISFGWYMRKITPVALVGYFAGLVCYWILRTFIFI